MDELVAAQRVPPGPGQIEVAVSASNVNFADVLVAFGRYPSFEGRLPQLGTDFSGVVTAVGPDVTGHRVGDQTRPWRLDISGAFPSGATSYQGKGAMMANGRLLRNCELKMTRV